MRSLDEIATRTRLSVVGVAKNCGKTTTLNCLLRHRRELELELPALVSIGVDGEEKDVVLGTEKPPIPVYRDQLVVTAEQAVQRSTAHFEYVRALGFSSPLGEVMACRVVDEGTVLLAGLRHRREVVEATQALESLGAAAVWIDGAYGRIAGAHPSLTDSVVVSTGAVVANTADAVASGTDDLASKLTLHGIDSSLEGEAVERAVSEGQLFFVDSEKGIVPLPIKSAVTGLDAISDQWAPTVTAIAIPGLVSDRVAEELLIVGGAGRTLLVPDGTVVHVAPKLWRRLRKEWNIRALKPIELVAISYNPTCITGRYISDKELKSALDGLVHDTVVFNPLH